MGVYIAFHTYLCEVDITTANHCTDTGIFLEHIDFAGRAIWGYTSPGLPVRIDALRKQLYLISCHIRIRTITGTAHKWLALRVARTSASSNMRS